MKPIQSMKTTDDTPYVVQYHPYDPSLPDVFNKIKNSIQSVAGSIVVEHIGSSSIPGIGGRNVLDIVIPTIESEQPNLRQILHELGFEDSPFPHYLPLLVGQVGYENQNYPILLYLVEPEANVLKDWLKFRNHMRTHTEDARAYDATKREVIAQGKVAGEDYQEAKTPFIVSISSKL